MTYKRLRTAKIGYLILSAALCVLGVVLIAMPELSAQWLCRFAGGLMLVFGTIKIIGYFSRDLYRLAFQHDLAMGILQLVLGCVLIFRASPVINIPFSSP